MCRYSVGASDITVSLRLCGQVYSQKLALAEGGKAIGWNARGLFNDDMLEFYYAEKATFV
jgi:hypothetical protein